MTFSMYQVKGSIKTIKNWNFSADFLGLIEFVKEKWVYEKFVVTGWAKDRLGDKYVVELITGGISRNESIVNALFENEMFKIMFYTEWKRGGYHKFEIRPVSLGYSTIAEYCKKHNVSRQAVHQSIHKFDTISISPKKTLVRLKPNM
jgi:hypothetical protein